MIKNLLLIINFTLINAHCIKLFKLFKFNPETICIDLQTETQLYLRTFNEKNITKYCLNWIYPTPVNPIVIIDN